MKAFASWGRYYDWTRYEIARGSYGGDLWHIYYRSLDTLDIASLNMSNMPGRDLWGGPNGFRDFRGNSIENTDPNIKPMYQDSFNGGLDFQLGARTALGVHYVHNNLGRTIEDLGALVNGDSIYVIGNPGEGDNVITPPSYPDHRARSPTPKPKRQYDALELTWERRFSKNWFANANYTWSRLYGNYSGTANSDEIQTPTTGITSKNAQQQNGTIARPGSNSHTGWDIDELMWDSHGNLDPRGRLATDRPHVVKLYGAYQFNFGTQLGAFFYGGSGTPITTQVVGLDAYAPMVNGRGDMGRTPVLTRTDLLVSHEFGLADRKRVRLELNIQNLFNQKTATHIFNYLNKGAPAGSQTPSAANAIDFSNVNLAAGYDYNALILADARGAQLVRPALRDGGPVPARPAGPVQREVHVLLATDSGHQQLGRLKHSGRCGVFSGMRNLAAGVLVASLLVHALAAQDLDALAQRGAAAAVELVRGGRGGQVWPLFRQSPDNSVRSHLIHALGNAGVDPRLVVDRLRQEPDVSARRALILSLGGFSDAQLPEEVRRRLILTLLERVPRRTRCRGARGHRLAAAVRAAGHAPARDRLAAGRGAGAHRSGAGRSRTGRPAVVRGQVRTNICNGGRSVNVPHGPVAGRSRRVARARLAERAGTPRPHSARLCDRAEGNDGGRVPALPGRQSADRRPVRLRRHPGTHHAHAGHLQPGRDRAHHRRHLV